jgi:hypothetical protein
MRSRSFAALGTLALLAAASAFGQSGSAFDIPFEFNVAGKVLPAGHYDVSGRSGTVIVQGYACSCSAVSETNKIGGTERNTQARLMFSKYGDKYFLAEAWTSLDTRYGSALPKSKTERETIHMTPGVSRIAIPAHTGVVALARLR